MTNVTVRCPACGFTARRAKIGPSWKDTATAKCPRDGTLMVNPTYRTGERVAVKGTGRRLGP